MVGHRFKQDGMDGSGISTLMTDAGPLDEIGRRTDATKEAYAEGVTAIAGEVAACPASADPRSARGRAIGLSGGGRHPPDGV